MIFLSTLDLSIHFLLILSRISCISVIPFLNIALTSVELILLVNLILIIRVFSKGCGHLYPIKLISFFSFSLICILYNIDWIRLPIVCPSFSIINS